MIKYISTKTHSWGARHSDEEWNVTDMQGNILYTTSSGWSDFWVGTKTVHDTETGESPDDLSDDITYSDHQVGQVRYIDFKFWIDVRDDSSPNGLYQSYCKVSEALREALGVKTAGTLCGLPCDTIAKTINAIIEHGLGPGKMIELDWVQHNEE